MSKSIYFSKDPANSGTVNKVHQLFKNGDYGAVKEMHDSGKVPPDFFLHFAVKARANPDKYNTDAGHVEKIKKITGLNELDFYHHAKDLAEYKFGKGDFERALDYLGVMDSYVLGDESKAPQKLQDETLNLRDKIIDSRDLQGKKEGALLYISGKSLDDKEVDFAYFKQVQGKLGITSEELVNFLFDRAESEFKNTNYYKAEHFNRMAASVSKAFKLPGMEKIAEQNKKIMPLFNEWLSQAKNTETAEFVEQYGNPKDKDWHPPWC